MVFCLLLYVARVQKSRAPGSRLALFVGLFCELGIAYLLRGVVYVHVQEKCMGSPKHTVAQPGLI